MYDHEECVRLYRKAIYFAKQSKRQTARAMEALEEYKALGGAKAYYSLLRNKGRDRVRELFELFTEGLNEPYFEAAEICMAMAEELHYRKE